MQCVCSVAASHVHLCLLSCKSALCDMQASIDGLIEADMNIAADNLAHTGHQIGNLIADRLSTTGLHS